jgi:hypothetical protein
MLTQIIFLLLWREENKSKFLCTFFSSLSLVVLIKILWKEPCELVYVYMSIERVVHERKMTVKNCGWIFILPQ